MTVKDQEKPIWERAPGTDESYLHEPNLRGMSHQAQVASLVSLRGLSPERGAKMLANCPEGRRGRFLVFAYDGYYPMGGLNDVAFDTDSLDDAKEAASLMRSDTVEIYDRIDDVEIGIR